MRPSSNVQISSYKVLKYKQIIQILHHNLRKLLKSGPEIFIKVQNYALCMIKPCRDRFISLATFAESIWVRFASRI